MSEQEKIEDAILDIENAEYALQKHNEKIKYDQEKFRIKMEESIEETLVLINNIILCTTKYKHLTNKGQSL